MQTPRLTDVQLAVLDALDRTSRGVADTGNIFVSARALKPEGFADEGLFEGINKIDAALAQLKRFGLAERRHESHGGRVVSDDHDGYYAILWRVEPARREAVRELLGDWRGRARPTPRSRPSSVSDGMSLD